MQAEGGQMDDTNKKSDGDANLTGSESPVSASNDTMRNEQSSIPGRQRTRSRRSRKRQNSRWQLQQQKTGEIDSLGSTASATCDDLESANGERGKRRTTTITTSSSDAAVAVAPPPEARNNEPSRLTTHQNLHPLAQGQRRRYIRPRPGGTAASEQNASAAVASSRANGIINSASSQSQVQRLLQGDIAVALHGQQSIIVSLTERLGVCLSRIEQLEAENQLLHEDLKFVSDTLRDSDLDKAADAAPAVLQRNTERIQARILSSSRRYGQVAGLPQPENTECCVDELPESNVPTGHEATEYGVNVYQGGAHPVSELERLQCNDQRSGCGVEVTAKQAHRDDDVVSAVSQSSHEKEETDTNIPTSG